jgi:hypothetical protein
LVVLRVGRETAIEWVAEAMPCNHKKAEKIVAKAIHIYGRPSDRFCRILKESE